MACITCLPVAAVFATVLIVMGEPRMAATVFAVVALAGGCLIELLTLSMKAVPFTCTYLPGQLKLRLYWAGYFTLWLMMVVRLGQWGPWALQSDRNAVRLALLLGVTWAALHFWHMVRVQRIREFIYDEQEPPLVTTMDIAMSMRQV